jgi:hypothetical protein
MTSTVDVCSSISDALIVAGIPSVRVSAEKDESGGEDTGAFTIQTEFGSMRLYLPSDLLEAYEHDRLARQKVRAAVSDLVVFLRQR